MSADPCPTCQHIHCARDVVAVGRFYATGVRGYRNEASDRLHLTRTDAITDLCAHHRHVAQVYAMGCDTQCRTSALAEAFRQHVLMPRRAAELAQPTHPPHDPAASAADEED